MLEEENFFIKHKEGMDFPMFNQNPWPALSSLVEYNQTLLAWIKSIVSLSVK